MRGPQEHMLRVAYAEHNPGAAIPQPQTDAAREEDRANVVFHRLVRDAVDAVQRALEITLRDAPGSATETMLQRWLAELAPGLVVEPMPDGAFEGPKVGANVLELASGAYWSCKLAQRGVRLTGGAS